MKEFKFFLLISLLLFAIDTKSQIGYTFTSTTGTYTTNAAGLGKTVFFGANSDEGISASTNIGFNISYGCSTYSTFQATTNGVVFLGTSSVATNNNNDLNTGADRPALAPLWDDLATSGTGEVSFKSYGITPNRYVIIEWKNMLWTYNAGSACVSFETILYETSSRIEFRYTLINSANIAGLPSASIGISGPTSGDYYSLNNTSAGPTASKIFETSTISTIPATNQIYRWDPLVCSGTPTAGTGAISLANGCLNYAPTVSVTGGAAGCGLTYQWQSTVSPFTTWNNIAGATSSSYTPTVTASTCYRRVTTCTNSSLSATSTSVCATIIPCVTQPQGAGVSSSYTLSCPGSIGFYDNGGSGNIYSANQTSVYTFSTSTSANCLSASFNSFFTQTTFDHLDVFDGPNVSSASLGIYSGSSLVPNIVSSGSALTFSFTSNGMTQQAGWDAVISCTSGCSGTPTGGTAVCSPSASCPSGYSMVATLQGASTGCGITHQWQSSTSALGPWTSINGATNLTYSTTISSTLFYQCVTTCSGSGLSANSSITSASVSTGPSNDDCNNATTVYPNAACGYGDVSCATQSQVACSGGNTANDVWFKFTASQTSHSIQVSASTSFDPIVQLFSGSCGSLVSINCDDPTYTTGGNGCKTHSSLTVGQLYYIRVYHAQTAVPATKTFTICVGGTISGACNFAYTNATTTYSLESVASLPNTINMGDDQLFSTKVPIGFKFCFDGFGYSDAFIASNSSLVFDAVGCSPNILTATYASNGAATGSTISGAAPLNSTSVPRNAILGPWHDIEPLTSVSTDDVRYGTIGTTPNQRFVVQFSNIRMYSNACNATTSSNFSGQIKIYETSNRIEVHLQNKQLCTSWNSGAAILGLHNYNGTIANVPAGYNYPTQWTAASQAWRWTTTCTQCVILPTGMEDLKADVLESNMNMISFKTQNDEEMLEFIVERSPDGIKFEQIGILSSKNSSNNSNYYLKDFITENKTYYYRVTSVNKNNEFSSSGLVAAERFAEMQFTTVSGVYPNPTKDLIWIEIDVFEKGIISAEIYDVLGNEIKSKTEILSEGFHQMDFSLGDLPAGMYFVKIFSENKQLLHVVRLVKE